ncbi:hypothetical protein ABT297_18055 [Dactylosporangium sp. NPDC000555]|uniref:hypothetical protein n=1 Tax=Dactylosporangium sp. NPDC000555 TaxID=3154260 RepID=UPI003324C7B7
MRTSAERDGGPVGAGLGKATADPCASPGDRPTPTRPVAGSTAMRLASRDRLDLVAAYGARYLARHPGHDERWAAGVAEARAGRPRPFANDLTRSLAWSVTTLAEGRPGETA